MRVVRCILMALVFIGAPRLADAGPAKAPTAPSTKRSRTAEQRRGPILRESFASRGLAFGAPVFIRVVKFEAALEASAAGDVPAWRPGRVEAWVQGVAGRYELFQSFPICSLSGRPGPKQKEFDYQGPEGIYDVTPDRLKPDSDFHLAMNVGYPNRLDQSLKRTGNYIMIHGSCASIGCFSIKDEGIEQLWTIVRAAMDAGQRSVPVHIFPFEMTSANRKHASAVGAASGDAADHSAWWAELQPVWDAFESSRIVPNVVAVKGRYRVKVASDGRGRADQKGAVGGKGG